MNTTDKKLPYVFFNTCPNKKKYIKELYAYTFVFDSSVLLNKKFYTNTSYSYGNLNTSKSYRYDSIKKINSTLNKLFKYSYTTNLENFNKSNRDELTMELVKPIVMKQFYIYQEVFLSRKISLKYAKFLILRKSNDEDNIKHYEKIVRVLNKKHPHIKIIYN
jgi:hypothetical protein